MADSEVKARKKLEEAEKKTRGGGGFLGKLFGGGGSDEAADLYIQAEGSTGSVEVGDGDYEDDDGSFVTCMEMGCGISFDSSPDYEEHYAAAHSHQCVVCSRRFASRFLLELHADERHCPFHRLRLERDPEGLHYRCLDEQCGEKFNSCITRDDHSKERHGIADAELQIERRKLARRQEEMDVLVAGMSVSGATKKKKRPVPRAVQFGGEQEKTFETRRLAKPWHKN